MLAKLQTYPRYSHKLRSCLVGDNALRFKDNLRDTLSSVRAVRLYEQSGDQMKFQMSTLILGTGECNKMGKEGIDRYPKRIYLFAVSNCDSVSIALTSSTTTTE